MTGTHGETLELRRRHPGKSEKEGARFRDFLSHAPVAIALLSGEEHRFEYVNDLYVQAVGRGSVGALLGLPIRDALPELQDFGVYQVLDEVYRSGRSSRETDCRVSSWQAAAERPQDLCFDFVYQPTFDTKGKVEGIFVLAVDSTEHTLSRRALEESEERFRLAQEAAEIGTWEWDPVENTRALSKEMHRMYGTDPSLSDEEFYKIWSSRVFKGDWPHVRLVMADCQRTGVMDVEYRYEHPEKGLRYHHSKGRRMLGTSRFFGVVGDITNRKRAEEAVSRREEEFRSLADAMPQLVWIADSQGYVNWFNERWYEYTGTTPEQNFGWGWRSVHDPLRLPEVLRRWQTSLDSGEPFEMVFPLRSKEGQYKPFLTRAVAVRDASGAITRWFGTNTDISGEFEIRRQIEESQTKLQTALDASQRLAAIVESSDDAIIGKDLNGIVTSWNPCAERMFGYTASEMINQSIKKIIPPEVFADEDRIMSAVAR